MSLPTLYKKTSTGKIQMWEISVGATHRTPTSIAIITTLYGLLDGKQQTASETIADGKNIGKSNETTPLQQAELEAKSQWEGKLKKGYVTSIDDANSGKVDDIIEGGVLPMLAHKFSEQGHKIVYPAYVQPKLDGHRCIAILKDGKCTLWSRTRKRITGVPHIEKAIENSLPNSAKDFIFDGELYNHDYRDKFEELTSFIRQETPKDGHEVVQYHIYDLVSDGSFDERSSFISFDLASRLDKKSPIVPVWTGLVVDENEMIGIFEDFLNQGYEGLMVRNADSLYENKRSYNLQKVKEFEDSEFEIKDVVEGRGKMAGLGIFVCTTVDGQEFNAKMRGSLDDLGEYFVNKDQYVGQMLTVKYQGLTKNGIPRFPIGERIRIDV